MVEAPLPDQRLGALRQLTLQDSAVAEGHQRFVALVFHVNVRRGMVREVHADVDAEKAGDDRHGGAFHRLSLAVGRVCQADALVQEELPPPSVQPGRGGFGVTCCAGTLRPRHTAHG